MALEAVLGIGGALWDRCTAWRQMQPQVEIARVFLDEPRDGDRNLTVAVVNNGSRRVYITVAVEGPGRQQQEQAPMALIADEDKAAPPGKAFDRPLGPHGKRRFYRRSIGMLNQFARHKGQVVVRSHRAGKRGVLARSNIPPHLWP